MSQSTKVLLPNTERLARLLQENLTQWENTFARSLLEQCTKSTFSSFSVKQEDKLRAIEHDYGMNRMDDGSPRVYKQSSCTTAAIKSVVPISLRPSVFEDMHLQKPALKINPVSKKSYFEDIDDDIPF